MAEAAGVSERAACRVGCWRYSTGGGSGGRDRWKTAGNVSGRLECGSVWNAGGEEFGFSMSEKSSRVGMYVKVRKAGASSRPRQRVRQKRVERGMARFILAQATEQVPHGQKGRLCDI